MFDIGHQVTASELANQQVQAREGQACEGEGQVPSLSRLRWPAWSSWPLLL